MEFPCPPARSGYRNGIWIDHMILICPRDLLPLLPYDIGSGGYEMCPECRTAYTCACDSCLALRALADLF